MADVNVSDVKSEALLQGRIQVALGKLLADDNDIILQGNKIVNKCIETRTNLVQALAFATEAAGISQAVGQQISGVCGIFGGAAGIAGGLTSLYGSVNHLADLKTEKLKAGAAEAGQVGAQGVAPGAAAGQADRVGALPDAVREDIALKYKPYEVFGGMLTQAVPGLMTGAGGLGQSTYTAQAATLQAEQQKAQALADAVSTQQHSTEGVVQSAAGYFNQVADSLSKALQWATTLAQRA